MTQQIVLIPAELWQSSWTQTADVEYRIRNWNVEMRTQICVNIIEGLDYPFLLLLIRQAPLFLPLYATTCITRLLVIDDCLNDLPLLKFLLLVINIGFLPMMLMCRIIKAMIVLMTISLLLNSLSIMIYYPPLSLLTYHIKPIYA